MSDRRGHHPLSVDEVAHIWELQSQEPDGYLKDFIPFSSENEMQAAVRQADQDLFMALTCDRQLCGFFMLRGLDAGFERPSFGVYVASAYAGQGLGEYALSQSEALCRAKHFTSLFLKVAADNPRARSLYERHGFQDDGLCPDTGHMTMTLDLSS